MSTFATLLDTTKALIVAKCATLDPAETVNVRRRYLPEGDLSKDFANLAIDVSPGGLALDLANRSELQSDQRIGVGFRQLLPAGMNPGDETANTWIDSRVNVVTIIARELARADFLIADLTEIGNAHQYDVESLRKDRLFMSLVTLTLTSIE